LDTHKDRNSHGISGRGRTISSAVLLCLGGLIGVTVPFLPWARGFSSRGFSTTGEGLTHDAFELAEVGVDMRILAYVIIGVGILGVIAGLGILKGSTRLAVPGAVAASIIALMLTMAVVASIAFAQMLGLAWIPASLGWGVGTGYSFPPALVALVAATVLMLGGAFLTPTYSKSRH
jgi:hypothetical protein